MRRAMYLAAGLLILGAVSSRSAAEDKSGAAKGFTPQLATYIGARIGEFDQIPEDRKHELKQVVRYVRGQIKAGQPTRLVFICTHNSRRSHLSQIWASDAAAYYGISGVECFSGGTEGTAFNPRAVAALERAGMQIDKTGDDKYPKYLVRIVDGMDPLVCFSKKYSDAANPQTNFCALMTCADADKRCPTVEGASLRVPIHYEDPKVADGTPQEADRYDERCAQISREMLYLFSQVAE